MSGLTRLFRSRRRRAGDRSGFGFPGSAGAERRVAFSEFFVGGLVEFADQLGIESGLLCGEGRVELVEAAVRSDPQEIRMRTDATHVGDPELLEGQADGYFQRSVKQRGVFEAVLIQRRL